jgi:hypothetical protein
MGSRKSHGALPNREMNPDNNWLSVRNAFAASRHGPPFALVKWT